jgi:sigma-B regulation protein RsbU (phosphoserine phosphatase)
MTANLFIAGIYLAGGLVLFLLGTVILRENPQERINRVTGTMMFFGGLGPILAAFGNVIASLRPEAGVLQSGFYFNFFYLWEFFFPQLVFFSLIYPREHTAIRRHPRIWMWIFLPHLFHLLFILIFSSPDQIISLLDPGDLGGRLGPLVEVIQVLLKTVSLLMAGLYQIHVKFFSAINLLYVIAAIIFLSRGYRALQDPLQKRQARTVLWGVRGSVGLYALAILVPVIAPVKLPLMIRSAFIIVALLFGAGTIAWGIVRHQFLGLRNIVRQGIVYSATTGILLTAYLIIIRQLDRLVARTLGIQVPYLDIGFVIIAVIFFQPLLGRMEAYSEKFFRRERSDYRNVLQRLTRDIISIFEIRQLHERISTTLRAASLTDRTALILKDERTDRFSVINTESDPDGQICFQQEDRTIKLMTSVRGPTTRREIEVFLAPEDRDKLDRLGAFLLVPISHGEQLLGLLCLGRKMGARRYNLEDVTMLSVLSGQMAIALVNARLYQETLEKRRFEEDLERARRIQESLLPKSCPSGEHFIISALNRPSRLVGGDYHDFVTAREGLLGIAIGDVSGKSLPAALLMAVLQASFNAQVQNDLAVRETVARVNAHMARFTDSDQFATFFYGELALRTGSFTYCNAGHNPPLIIRAGGEIEELCEGGLILGVMGDADYREGTVSLAPGDMLFLYTDGITEAKNSLDEEYGLERLTRLLVDIRRLPPDDLLDIIFEEANRFSTGGLLQQDDTTLLTLKLDDGFRCVEHTR